MAAQRPHLALCCAGILGCFVFVRWISTSPLENFGSTSPLENFGQVRISRLGLKPGTFFIGIIGSRQKTPSAIFWGPRVPEPHCQATKR